MSRPTGVIAAAIVDLIGCVFLLLAGLVMITTNPGSFPAADQPPYLHAILVGMGSFLFVLTALGIWTAIALLHLRPWARMSMLVFAAIMTVTSLGMIAIVSFVPLSGPQGRNPASLPGFLPALILICAIPGAIGAWWIVQFNKRATKDAFGVGIPNAPSQEAVSISILGWLFLINAAFSIVPAVAGVPHYVAGVVFTRWGTRLVYIVLLVLSIYIGRGLLRREERARQLAIAYLVLYGLYGVVVALVPGMREKMIALQKTVAAQQHTTMQMDLSQLMNVTAVLGLLISAVAVWLLIRNKAVFKIPTAG
jgi:hypothetical protein